jgi:hypothetical protein
MITLSTPNYIEQMLIPNLLNWEKIRVIVQSTTNTILQVAHKTVETKLHYANMQLNSLNQLYNMPSSFEKDLIRRSLFESTIVNLVSSLESTAHIINQVYELGIDYKTVTIDHKFFYNEKKHSEASKKCLRCKVKIVNPPLASFLDKALKRGSPIEEWYEAVMEYRHQIVHRPHFVALLVAGKEGYYIPDDPKIIGTKSTLKKGKTQPIFSNFTLMRELKHFAETSTSLILFIVEAIFNFILDDDNIKQRMSQLLNF